MFTPTCGDLWKVQSEELEWHSDPKQGSATPCCFEISWGFCICAKISMHIISLDVLKAYLEFLVENKVPLNRVANNVWLGSCWNNLEFIIPEKQ